MSALASAQPAIRRGGAATWTRRLRLVGARLLQLVIVVLVLVVGTAVIVRLVPGDPAQAILGLQATPESLAQLRQELGLDQSIAGQVLDQLAGVARGDLGESTAEVRPVMEMLTEAFPVSLALMAFSIAISVLVAVPLGLLPSLLRSRRFDRILGVSMIVVLAVPTFVVGMYLLLIAALEWGLAPPGGWGDGWPGNLEYVWLPAVTLAFLIVPMLVRAVQRSAGGVLGEEFVEAARARGLDERTIIVRHVLPNVLLPLITLVGYSASVLLGGAVVVEAVFGIPGFGQVVVDAVSARDYPVIVGATLFSAVFVVAVNLVTDVLYAVADPRTRVQG